MLLQAQGDLAGAAPLYREALAGRRVTLGDEHPDTLVSINNLGMLLYAQGDLAGATPLYREALAGSRAMLGDQHPDTLTSINNLGSLLKAQGEVREALALLQELRVAWGEESPPVLLEDIRSLEREAASYRADRAHTSGMVAAEAAEAVTEQDDGDEQRCWKQRSCCH